MIRRRTTEDLPDDPRAALAQVRDPFRRLRANAVFEWFRDHPDVADGVLALSLFVVGTSSAYTVDMAHFPLHREADAWYVLLVAALTWPIALRRRTPRLALAITMLAVPPFLALNYVDNGTTLGTLICLYTVASICERRRAVAALFWSMAILLPILIAGVIVEQERLPIPMLLGNLAIYVAAWSLGNAVRNRRDLVRSLEQRAEEAERRREAEAARAVEEERARIARELHDVVAHGLSVMVVQAGGARRIVETDPAQAVEALRIIEATGRESMAEMRRLLGVLRDGSGTAADAAPELAPQPGLAALDRLVGRWTDAGMPVGLEVVGEPRPLSSGTDVAAFRIVQEALTNVSKHAGPARAEVVVRFTDRAVELTVTDDGRGAATADDGAGQGLVGMRERAALYRGTVSAGPRPGGGFEVHAVLPLADAPAPAAP